MSKEDIYIIIFGLGVDMMGIRPQITEENEKDIANSLTCVNLNRTHKFAWILFLANLILLYIDYNNKKNGLWILTSSYKLLFYSHIGLGLGTFFYILALHKLKVSSKNQLSWFHAVCITLFTFFILNLGAIISGWVDQRIHGQITVYLIACFTIAVLCYQKPRITALLYGFSYIVFMFLVTLSQKDPNIRMGHYVNVSLLA